MALSFWLRLSVFVQRNLHVAYFGDTSCEPSVPLMVAIKTFDDSADCFRNGSTVFIISSRTEAERKIN